jgi:hypothetical protein
MLSSYSNGDYHIYFEDDEFALLSAGEILSSRIAFLGEKIQEMQAVSVSLEDELDSDVESPVPNNNCHQIRVKKQFFVTKMFGQSSPQVIRMGGMIVFYLHWGKSPDAIEMRRVLNTFRGHLKTAEKSRS